MARYFVEWELAEPFDYSKAKERVKTAKQSSRVKDWGVYVGMRKGYTVFEVDEDTEITQILNRLGQTGFHIIDNHRVLTLDDYDALLEKLR